MKWGHQPQCKDHKGKTVCLAHILKRIFVLVPNFMSSLLCFRHLFSIVSLFLNARALGLVGEGIHHDCEIYAMVRLQALTNNQRIS